MSNKIILSPEQIESVELMAGRGLTLDDIALILRISPKTLDRRLSDCEEVREAYDRGRAIAKRTVVNSLFDQIAEGKIAAIIFYLKTQCGWRESEKVESDRHEEIHIYLPEKESS